MTFRYKILIILLSFLQTAFPTLDGVDKLLTKKSSLLWLRNETSLQNGSDPYCSICCVDVNQVYKGRQCGIHTMCAYRTYGPACKGLIVMEFSQNEIYAIVDAHNTLRNRIAMGLEQNGDPGPQPFAANMRLMSWDNELARVALRWASQCVYSHDKCRDLDRFPVGQNIGKGTYASRTVLQYVADWYRWVELVDEGLIRSYVEPNQSGFNSFTQIVWADTYLVGCARVSFQTPQNAKIVYKEHFVCNYGPSGNIPKQSVYKIGEPCSGCADGSFCTDPEYPGLCNTEVFNETDLEAHRKKHRKRLGNGNERLYVNQVVYGTCFLLIIYIL